MFCLAVHYKLHHPAEEHSMNRINNYLLKYSSFPPHRVVSFHKPAQFSSGAVFFIFFFAGSTVLSVTACAEIRHCRVLFVAICFVHCGTIKAKPLPPNRHISALPRPPRYYLDAGDSSTRHLPLGRSIIPRNIQGIGEGAEKIASQMRSAVQKLTLA